MKYKLTHEIHYNTRCHIFTYDPNVLRTDVSLGVVNKLEALKNMRGEPLPGEAVVAKMNGSFFAMDGKHGDTYSTFVDGTLYYQPSAHMYPTLIMWKDNIMTIEHNPDTARLSYYQGNALFAIGMGWTLIVNGKIDYTYTKEELIKAFSHPWSPNPRTMIGQKVDGTVVWVVTDGRNTGTYDRGLTIDEQAAIMQKHGCVIAASADGGGSTEMRIGSTLVNKLQGGWSRSIGTAFFAYGKLAEVEPSKNNIIPPIISITPVIGKITANVLNVRSGPGSTYPIIDKASIGETITIAGTNADGTWYYTTTGWMSASYVIKQIVPSTSASAITTTSLRLRSGPSTYHNTICIMPKNSKLVILNTNTSDEWYNVEYNKYTGYAHSSYINIL